MRGKVGDIPAAGKIAPVGSLLTGRRLSFYRESMASLFAPPYTYLATVHRVIDGDTVEVTIDLGFGVLLKNRKVRLAGINAPEMNTESGMESRVQLRQMIYDYGQRSLDPSSDDVTLLIATKLDRGDKYGRVLGRLRGFDRQDGMLPIDINAKMLEQEFAVAAKE